MTSLAEGVMLLPLVNESTEGGRSRRGRKKEKELKEKEKEEEEEQEDFKVHNKERALRIRQRK